MLRFRKNNTLTGKFIMILNIITKCLIVIMYEIRTSYYDVLRKNRKLSTLYDIKIVKLLSKCVLNLQILGCLFDN